jgi:hypothetical protein
LDAPTWQAFSSATPVDPGFEVYTGYPESIHLLNSEM